ncbi:hypothetical protein HII31_09222, partial [Pseudocercospora fuligena]
IPRVICFSYWATCTSRIECCSGRLQTDFCQRPVHQQYALGTWSIQQQILAYALVDFDKQQVFVTPSLHTRESSVGGREHTVQVRCQSINRDEYLSCTCKFWKSSGYLHWHSSHHPTFSEDAQSGATQPPSSSDGKSSKKDKTMPPPQQSTNGQVSGVNWHEIQFGTGLGDAGGSIARGNAFDQR